ncbi:MAG: TldD/PmbA family protein, partial [Clostridiales bacterium]|nr:TldD/PmbA family protein [Clostridiales bacterium]
MIDKATACDVLTAALSTGGDFAEIFAEHNVRNRLEIVNGITESVSSRIIYGAGIRLFIGTSAIYAYTNDLTRENLIAVAKAVAATLDKNAKTPVERFLNFEYESAHKYIIMPADFEKKAIIERLRLASDYSKKASTSIKQTNSSYQDSVQDVLIANSDGLWAEDRRVRNRTVVTAVASNETEKQTATSTQGAIAGVEYFNSVDFAALGDEVGKCAATMLSAKYAPSGKMPVVIDNGFGGVI